VQDGTNRLVFNGPYTVGDKVLLWNVACPTELSGLSSFAYTATANELTLYQPQGGSETDVLVHRRVQ
jgi:hypothetical protein